MPSRAWSPSGLRRAFPALERLPRLGGLSLWLFLAWSAVGLVVLAGRIPLPGGGWGDLVFMALASVLIAVDLAVRYGGNGWWIAFAIIATGSGLVEGVGTLTGIPFGHYTYTAAFGPKVAGILPVAIPLAWWIVLMGLRETLLAFPVYRKRRAPVRMVVLAVGAVLVDLVIEPFAWQVRGYWLWSGGGVYFNVPALNFLGWFGTALLLGGLSEPWLAKDRAIGRRWATGRSLAPGVLGVVLLSFVFGLLAAGFLIPALLGLILAAIALVAGWRRP
ncbi:MAG: carotenoid biosynthesis protein [Opitutales bacterium]